MLDTVSTGISGLDHVIDSLRLGDNVVWQVTDLSEYRQVVRPYLRQALQEYRILEDSNAGYSKHRHFRT